MELLNVHNWRICVFSRREILLFLSYFFTFSVLPAQFLFKYFAKYLNRFLLLCEKLGNFFFYLSEVFLCVP